MSSTGAPPNATKFGKYQVVTRKDGRPMLLGSGACGNTYQATHSILGTTVALKVIHENLAYDLEVKQRFINEARAIAALKHPHIAQLVDCDEADGALFYAMEFCDGGDLEKLVSSRGPLPDETVLQFGRQAAGALAYVHDQGYLHRDLKPSNLMLSMARKDEANLKVIDFGLVKTLGVTSGLTQRGHFRGTLLYTPPEQLREEELDERADVFALGVSLWFLLAGGAPIKDDSREIARQRLSGDGHAAQLPKKSHPAVRALLTEMLQPERKRRVRNMHIVLSGIEECLVQMRGSNGRASVPAANGAATRAAAVVKSPQSESEIPAKPADAPNHREPIIAPTGPTKAIDKLPPGPKKPPVMDDSQVGNALPKPPQAPRFEQRKPAIPQGAARRPDLAASAVGIPRDPVLRSQFTLIEERHDAHTEWGTTFAARRNSTGELVQLTKLDRRLATNSQAVRQLEEIIAGAKRCAGHFIIQPHSLIRFADELVLIEEEVIGLEILSILKSRQKVSLLEASAMLRQLAEACDLAMQADFKAIDLELHHLILQFPRFQGSKISEAEAVKMLSRASTHWPPYIVRVQPAYGAAQRATAGNLGGSANPGSTVVTGGLDDSAEIPCRYACLMYHLLSGLPVQAAATLSRAGYVPISSVGEEANRLLARVVSGEFPMTDCFSLLRSICYMESVPIPPLALPPGLERREGSAHSVESPPPKPGPPASLNHPGVPGRR